MLASEINEQAELKRKAAKTLASALLKLPEGIEHLAVNQLIDLIIECAVLEVVGAQQAAVESFRAAHPECHDRNPV
jgi:hypothetical protein